MLSLRDAVIQVLIANADLPVHHKRVQLPTSMVKPPFSTALQLVGTAICSASRAALRDFSKASGCSGTIPRSDR